MSKDKKVYACDAETDPFKHGRVPRPFLWGLYDGKTYINFRTTAEFVDYIKTKRIIVYAHNGGKFDFMFLLPFVTETKAQVINGRIVCMFVGLCELRDSLAICPEALKNIKKKSIEFWKLEEDVRYDHWEEIVDYHKHDCIYLWQLVTTYRRVAGKRTTVASNALAFAKKLGINPGKSNHRFDKRMRRFYFGGRVECFKPGTQDNIYLLDIHSAYPFAMMHDHATGIDFHRKNSLAGLSEKEIQRSFIHLSGDSDGAFPIRKYGVGGGLQFPNGFGDFYITGWEYLVAKEFNLIHNERILSVRYTNDTITFKPYVQHWYKYKNEFSAKNADGTRKFPHEYATGKYMQNSLYGKLSQNPSRYYDYKIVPAATPICDYEPSNEDSDICGLCNMSYRMHGWQLHREFEGHEIHRRHSLWKWKVELGVEWEAKNLYHNVASGASITGFTRAHLLKTMCLLGREHIIYCDTDGIVCSAKADLRAIPMSDDVGDWELEDHSPRGHFAGKKLYGISLSRVNPENGKPFTKIASKGSKLAYEDLTRLVAGDTIRWENPAPSFSIDGSAKWVHRDIRATVAIPATALTTKD